MKLRDSFELVGAVHMITIGRRVKRLRGGRERVCRPWMARWYERGREHSRSLKTTNRQAAIRAAMELDRQLSSGVNLMRRSLSTKELNKLYLDARRGERRAPKTLQKYTFVLSEFDGSLPLQVQADASRLTSDHFWSYSNHLTEKGNAENTWYDKLIIIKQLGRWAETNQKLAHNPFKSCKIPEPAPTKQPCFSPEQVVTIIAAAEGQLRTIVTVLLLSGIRFGELRDLTWACVDFKAKGLIIETGGSSGTTKSRRRRTIPMHPAVEAELRKHPRRGERVFYQEASERYPRGDHPLDERRLLRAFKRLCKRAGLANPDQYRLHTCRHAFASMLAPRVSERYGLELLGQRESEVLRRYITLYDRELSRAVNSIELPPAPAANHGRGAHRGIQAKNC